MTESEQKEDISMHYLGLLCARSGIDFERTHHDDDGTDVILKKRFNDSDNQAYDTEIHFQLKATSSKSQYTETAEEIRYRLKAKNYNDLCIPSIVPLYLAVLILPERQAEWISWNEEDLLIHGRMYYYSLEDKKKTVNEHEVTIKIDKADRIDESVLSRMLRQAKLLQFL